MSIPYILHGTNLTIDLSPAHTFSTVGAIKLPRVTNSYVGEER